MLQIPVVEFEEKFELAQPLDFLFLKFSNQVNCYISLRKFEEHMQLQINSSQCNS